LLLFRSRHLSAEGAEFGSWNPNPKLFIVRQKRARIQQNYKPLLMIAPELLPVAIELRYHRTKIIQYTARLAPRDGYLHGNEHCDDVPKVAGDSLIDSRRSPARRG